MLSLTLAIAGWELELSSCDIFDMGSIDVYTVHK